MNNYQIINNFLDYKLFNELCKLSKSLPILYDSNKLWPVGLGYGNILISEQFTTYMDDENDRKLNDSSGTPVATTHPKPIISFQNILISFLNLKNKFRSISSTFYDWHNSNITWHDDGAWFYGITLYLNEHWNENWGGELLLEDNTFVKPEPNRLVIINIAY